jgi:hypothetical protein
VASEIRLFPYLYPRVWRAHLGSNLKA